MHLVSSDECLIYLLLYLHLFFQEIRETKANVAESYDNKIKELENTLTVKKDELTEVNRISFEQKQAIEDLNERLTASLQSCLEANEIVKG